MLRYHGTLVEWSDDRGFGFIQPDQGGARVFVHISAWQPRPQATSRPQVGLRLEFAVGMEGGKPRAQQVTWQPGVRPRTGGGPRAADRMPSGARASGHGSYVVILAFALVWAGSAVVWGVPRWVLPGCDCGAAVVAPQKPLSRFPRTLLAVRAGQCGGVRGTAVARRA